MKLRIAGSKCQDLLVISLIIAIVCLQAFLVAKLLKMKQSSSKTLHYFESSKVADRMLKSWVEEDDTSSVDDKVTKGLSKQQDTDSLMILKNNDMSAKLSLHQTGPGSLPLEARTKLEYFEHRHKKMDFHSDPAHIDIVDYGPEVLVETDNTLTPRPLTDSELAGNNILFTLRTTVKFHESRLPILFDTWLSVVNTSNVYLVTDGEDEEWRNRASAAGVRYFNVPCKPSSYLRNDLCCKAGAELSLMFREESIHYDWLCHVDDDIYVIVKPLVEQLSKFLPKDEPVYFGRSGSAWTNPHRVVSGSQFGTPGQPYHFAVGGMYCLSRAMLELAQPYLVGSGEFSRSCEMTLEPEDVTVGAVVGVVLNQHLSRTEMIYTHGLILQAETLRLRDKVGQQIAYAYGYGAVDWADSTDTVNHIAVPNALFSFEEDKSQFYSLHCFLHLSLPKCARQVKKQIQLLRQKKH